MKRVQIVYIALGLIAHAKRSECKSETTTVVSSVVQKVGHASLSLEVCFSKVVQLPTSSGRVKLEGAALVG